MKEDVGQPSRRRLNQGRCGSTESTTFDLREGVGQPSQRRSMRGGVGQPSRRRLTDTEKFWREMIFFAAVTISPLYFQIYKRGM